MSESQELGCYMVDKTTYRSVIKKNVHTRYEKMSRCQASDARNLNLYEPVKRLKWELKSGRISLYDDPEKTVVQQ
jgi:hypothetical protein